MKFKKYMVPLLIIFLFVIHTSLMFYEYVNYNGFDIFSLKNMVDCKFLICTGDLTTWFNHQIIIDYRIYAFITLIAVGLSIIEYKHRKDKLSLLVLVLWIILSVVNVIPMIVLLGQKYGLILMLYYEGFITMQFLQIKNVILSISYLIYITIFISYMITIVHNVLKKAKHSMW